MFAHSPLLLSFELFPLRCMMLGSKGGETCDHCFQRVKLGPKTRRCLSASVIPLEKTKNAGIPNNELFASSGGNGSLVSIFTNSFQKTRKARHPAARDPCAAFTRNASYRKAASSAGRPARRVGQSQYFEGVKKSLFQGISKPT